MDTERLLDKVQNKLQDFSYAREDLLLDLNDLLKYVSAIHPLPSLQDTSTVVAVAGDVSVAMPDNYHCNLYRVENTTTSRACKIVFNFKVLAAMHDGLTVAGSVVDATIENGFLYYRKTPASDENLLLYYNKTPTTLTDESTSTPDCIPTHLHDLILVSYLLYDKFSEIEEDIDEAKNNTIFYWNRFLTGIQGLNAFYPNTSLQNTYQRFHNSNNIMANKSSEHTKLSAQE